MIILLREVSMFMALWVTQGNVEMVKFDYCYLYDRIILSNIVLKVIILEMVL